MSSNEKEDGVRENKLCNELDAQCGISSNSTQGIDSINVNNNNSTSGASICANCGKEGIDNDMNTCNKCNLVKYCNAACKKKHRSKHKKQCERRVAELHDEELFREPPSQYGDCPICFLRIPSLPNGRKYYECCGKEICCGCINAPVYDNQGNKIAKKICPFCRLPMPTSDLESFERAMKLTEKDNAIAIHNLGWDYRDGTVIDGKYGLPQDYTKALELWHRAGELGSVEAYCDIGSAYHLGEIVEVDEKKARHYYELAAMGGNAQSRHNLGILERDEGIWIEH